MKSIECKIDGCGRTAQSKGLCSKHYYLVRRYGSIIKPEKEKKICCIDDCDRNAVSKKLCTRHYNQLIRYGRVLSRTNRDKNEYIKIDDNIMEVICFDKRNEEKGRFIINIEDYDKIKGHKWGIGGGYVKTKIKGIGSVPVHRFLLDILGQDIFVDHIDGDPTNNTRENLRLADDFQNAYNAKTPKNNKSGRTGVFLEGNRWRAYIRAGGKQMKLGSFLTFEDACKAREEAEIKYFGEYRRKT